MIPILVQQLAASGLSLLGNALLKKGKEAVEEKLGVKLPDIDKPVSDEKLSELRALEMDHEERLLELAIREKELEIDAEKAQNKEVTDRWRIDMSSDSWLSKNTRPMIVLYLTAIISLMAFASQWLQVSEPWIDLLATAYVTVIVAYFGSRGVEKVTSWRAKK